MNHPSRRYVAALCCTGLAAPVAGQDGMPVFRATSELVLLDVQVIQKKTATSTAVLQREDVQVFEDGLPQRSLSSDAMSYRYRS